MPRPSAYSLPTIQVIDPVTHNTWDKGKFTSYKIFIKTRHPSFRLRLSGVRRRFSELRWLHSYLKQNHPYVSIPRAPSKKLLGERFGKRFICERSHDMQRFLNEVVQKDVLLSDTAAHLFLQTDLTTQEIEHYFEGRIKDDFVEKVWDEGGHIHTCDDMSPFTPLPPVSEVIHMDEDDIQPLHIFHKTSYNLKNVCDSNYASPTAPIFTPSSSSNSTANNSTSSSEEGLSTSNECHAQTTNVVADPLQNPKFSSIA